MQQMLIQQQLNRRSPATAEPLLNKSIPMQSGQLMVGPQQQQQPQHTSSHERHHLTRTQQQLNAALFNADTEQVVGEGSKYAMTSSNRNSTGIVDEDANDRELHTAEQLVANADKQKRSPFQFDTIEPKNRNRHGLSLMQDSGIGELHTRSVKL